MNNYLTIKAQINGPINSELLTVENAIAADMIIRHRRRRLLKAGFDGV